MDVRQLCDAIRQKAALELREAAGPAGRSEILIAALYEVSRSVLPELGVPKKSKEYLESQGVVLDLITFLTIPLIREGGRERRGVAVLSEIAEGCLDPQLKKKSSVYAQELLAKSGRKDVPTGYHARRVIPWLIGSVAIFALYLSWPNAVPTLKPGAPEVTPAPRAAPGAPAVPQEPAHATAVVRPAADPAPAREPGDADGGKAERSAPEGQGGASAKVTGPPTGAGPQAGAAGAQGGAGAQGSAGAGEQTLRIRIVNNQVLVPVTLKNGGGSVRVELLLDTGATRTAIHESITGKLPLDLRLARSSQAVVADGRVIRSRIARIDALVVGPFALSAPEVALIPYQGEDNAHDGLLGMDFLGRHRYQIDMEHQLIRWF